MSAPTAWGYEREWVEVYDHDGRQLRRHHAQPRWFATEWEAHEHHREDRALAWAQPHQLEPAVSPVRPTRSERRSA